MDTIKQLIEYFITGPIQAFLFTFFLFYILPWTLLKMAMGKKALSDEELSKLTKKEKFMDTTVYPILCWVGICFFIWTVKISFSGE